MKTLKIVHDNSTFLNIGEWLEEMSVTQIEDNIFLIDAETVGIRDFVASYVLKGEKVAMVETGPSSSVPNLLTSLKRLSVEPEDVVYVAVSHIHLDHAGGVGTLVKHLPNAKVIVHPRGAPHLVHPEKLWEQSKVVLGNITAAYGEPEPVSEDRILPAPDGTVFDIGNDVTLKIVETVGHASHHQSYYERHSRGVFSGDAAGIYVKEIDAVVPTTPPPLRLDLVLSSIDKLLRLEPASLFYSHFGKASNASQRLRSYAEQLKLWAKIAKEGLDRHDSLESIREQIIKNDSAVRKALAYVRNHRVLADTVLTHSVEGIVNFVQKSSVPE